jgi:hypothetical protein
MLFAFSPKDRFTGRNRFVDAARAAYLSRSFEDGQDLRDARWMASDSPARRDSENRSLERRPLGQGL